MKWFKENWLTAVLVGIILFLLTDSVIKSKARDKEISSKSDSIAILKYQYSELEKRDTLALELISAYEFAYTAYQDSLQNSKTEYIKQKKRHEKQVADLSRVSTDSLYTELGSWLDTISFQ